MSFDDVTARVEVRDGMLVLVDDTALGVIAAVEAHNRGVAYQNCLVIKRHNAERIEHFKRRAVERLLPPKDAVLVILDADDQLGGALAEHLMRGHDWQQYRDKGQIPLARGLAMREGIVEVLRGVLPELARQLETEEELALLILHGGTGLVERALRAAGGQPPALAGHKRRGRRRTAHDQATR